MAGYTRMTYSLGVIMMETSQDLSIFVPLILTIIVANQTGYIFTRSLYQRATRGKQMPIISDKIPGPCKNLKAGDIMAANPLVLKGVSTVAEVINALEGNNHHAFPLVNKSKMLIGIIPRNFMMVLIREKAWYSS